tara:strand:- start:45696 stop:46526 length:831 start_codon:yes stop_codon:yes gene_type:complete
MLNINKELIKEVILISEKAGCAILDIYDKSDIEINIKDDKSPLTQADIASHNIIVKSLNQLTPKIPILSEESSQIDYSVRSKWSNYWLIDPLDGTKEFLKKNGEFTVNIALIENNTPVLGVIFVPVRNQYFWGSKEFGSFYSSDGNSAKKLKVSEGSWNSLRIVTSRSHINEELEVLLKEIDSFDLVSIGSSLKFCLIAAGKADIYPRFGLTSEWDTAAGEAIVRFAGGYITNIDGNQMTYNSKDSLINSHFVVSCNKEICQKFLNLSKKKISSGV